MREEITKRPDGADSRPLVAHVVYRFDIGGLENGLVNLINGIPSEHYRHAVICVTQSSDFAERLAGANVEVYELNKREGKDPSFYIRFWKLVRRLKPNILHSRNLGTLDLALLGMLARVPIRIHSEHGWDARDIFGRNRKYRLLRKVCDRAITEYIAVSKDIKRWLCDDIGISTYRVQHIFNGVDADHFKPNGPKAELQFEAERKGGMVIGTVGRLDPIKNFDLLISAFAIIVANRVTSRGEMRLVIIGDGPEREKLEDLTVELGIQSMAFTPGNRADVADLLRSFDLFVLPSSNEGISNTILEAMSTGLPVVATKVGGNPELVINGETGFLVLENDVDALVNAIEGYMNAPQLIKLHGRAARQRAIRSFSLAAMVQSYVQMYDRLLGVSAAKRLH